MSVNELLSPEQLRAAASRKLREALARLEPALRKVGSEPEVRKLVLEAVEAVGRCLLFGCELPPSCDQLPLEHVRAALPEACARLRRLAQRAELLGEHWDDEPDQAVRDQMCLEALADRLDAQALCVGLMHCLQRAEERGELDVDELLDLSEPLNDALEQYDAALREQAGLLSTVRDDPQLAQWRAALAESYRVVIPWWLGPGLDEAASEARREVARLVNDVLTAASCSGEPEAEAEAIVCSGASHMWDSALPAYCMISEPAEEMVPVEAAYPKTLFVSVAAKAGRRQLWLVWHDPRRKYQAQTRVNFPLEDKEQICLQFVRTADGEEAVELAGTRASLADVVTSIDNHGQCTFEVKKVRARLARGARVALRVERGTVWESWLPDKHALLEVKRVVEQG